MAYFFQKYLPLTRKKLCYAQESALSNELPLSCYQKNYISRKSMLLG